MQDIIGKLKDCHYTCLAVRENFEYHSLLKGIAPLLEPMQNNILYFKDCYVVDRVIGKSAAMLLIKSQIRHIHALILSEHAKSILERYNISYSYETLVPYIINRSQDGMCPMEESVLNIEDIDQAFDILQKK